MTAILEADPLAAGALREVLGDSASVVDSFDALGLTPGKHSSHPTIVVGPSVDTDVALEVAAAVLRIDPTCGVILVRRRIDATVLAAALRAGVREVVSDRDHAALTDAVRRHRSLTATLRSGVTAETEAEVAEHKADGRVFTVFSPKGGAGKTTVATNVAATLVASGKRTLLIDLDTQFGDVAISLGLHPEHSVADVVELGNRLDVSSLRRLVTHHGSSLHVLAAPSDPGALETVSTDLLRRLLSVARGEYEYVIIDTAPTLDDVSVTVMENSDTVFMVTTLDIPALKNTKLALRTLRMVNFPTDRVSAVMNRCDAKVGLQASEVEASIGIPVVGRIPSSAAVPSATNRGVTVVTDQPRHAVSRAFENLVTNNITHEPAAAQASRFTWRHK